MMFCYVFLVQLKKHTKEKRKMNWKGLKERLMKEKTSCLQSEIIFFEAVNSKTKPENQLWKLLTGAPLQGKLRTTTVWCCVVLFK